MKFFDRTTTTAIIAVFGTMMSLTSCQQDQYGDELTPLQTEDETTEATEVNDSVFTNNFQFNYDDLGPTTSDQYVEDINFDTQKNCRFTRGGGDFSTSTIAFGLLKFVGEKLFAAATTKSATAIVNPIFDAIFGVQDQMKVLNDLASNIDNVQKMITDLHEQSENNSISDLFYKRYEKYNTFAMLNATSFDAYMQAVAKNDTVTANAILEDWASQQVNGTTTPNAVYDYLGFISETLSGSQMTIPDVYDYWVFQTTPWEHEGYVKREQLRASDIYTAATGYILACAYFETKHSAVYDKKVNMYMKAYDNFINFYKKHFYVEHHDSQIICQIKGAHCVFNKSLVERDIYNHPWIASGNRMEIKNYMYGEVGHDADYVLSHSLTPDEAQAIFNYYNNGKAEKTNMKQILLNAGFDFTKLSFTSHRIMTLNTGASMENEHWWNENYILKFDKAFDMKSTSNPMQTDFTPGMVHCNKKNYTKSCMTYKVVDKWVNYNNSYNYCRADIDRRYSGTQAFEDQVQKTVDINVDDIIDSFSK